MTETRTCAACGATRLKRTMILDLADWFASAFFCNLACFRANRRTQ